MGKKGVTDVQCMDRENANKGSYIHIAAPFISGEPTYYSV